MPRKFQKSNRKNEKSRNKWIIVGIFFIIFLVINLNVIQINTAKIQEILDKGMLTLKNLEESFSSPQIPQTTPIPISVPIMKPIPTSTLKSTSTSIEVSKSAINSINSVRQKNGLASLRFDERIYHLALARTSDMLEYHYMDHTNPSTGTCPDNMKYRFGFSSNEYLAENAYGSSRMYYSGIEGDAIETWLGSRGHRYNLLYPHSAGAVACSGGYCVFLGLNSDHFGEGCYTGEEGTVFWKSVGRQPYEV